MLCHHFSFSNDSKIWLKFSLYVNIMSVSLQIANNFCKMWKSCVCLEVMWLFISVIMLQCMFTGHIGCVI